MFAPQRAALACTRLRPPWNRLEGGSASRASSTRPPPSRLGHRPRAWARSRRPNFLVEACRDSTLSACRCDVMWPLRAHSCALCTRDLHACRSGCARLERRLRLAAFLCAWSTHILRRRRACYYLSHPLNLGARSRPCWELRPRECPEMGVSRASPWARLPTRPRARARRPSYVVRQSSCQARSRCCQLRL